MRAPKKPTILTSKPQKNDIFTLIVFFRREAPKILREVKFLIFLVLKSNCGIIRYARAGARDQKHQKMSEILFPLEVLDPEKITQTNLSFFCDFGVEIVDFLCARASVRDRKYQKMSGILSSSEPLGLNISFTLST